MSFVTTTLRDTVVNAAGAGGTVTVKAIFDNDTADNLILDAHSLSGFANGAKLDLLRAWWGLTQGSADDDTGHIDIQEKGASSDVVQIRLAGTGHYDGTAGPITNNATNTGATSGDLELSLRNCSGSMIIELRKDENFTS